MGGKHWSFHFIIVLSVCVLCFCCISSMAVLGLPSFPATAEAPTSWTIDRGQNLYVYAGESVSLNLILVQGISSQTDSLGSTNLGFGFFPSYGSHTVSWTLAVFVFSFLDDTLELEVPELAGDPVVLWSANRNHPVNEGATLHFKTDGGLVLKDTDGSVVWFTDTSGCSVARMSLIDPGNLLLLNDSESGVVWQSFDYPTDTWLNGQTLRMGQQLTSSVSRSNFSAGLFQLSLSSNALLALIDSNPPIPYIHMYCNMRKIFHISDVNWNIRIYCNSQYQVSLFMGTNNFSYLRLESDGHLKAYEYGYSDEHLITDVFQEVQNYKSGGTSFGNCAYPTVCGSYGICEEGSCSCPQGMDGKSSYFREFAPYQPQLGCVPLDPLSCPESNQLHTFLDLGNVSYFSFAPSALETTIDNCKTACLIQCSCKAALFHYKENTSFGNCSLTSELLSLQAIWPHLSGYNAIASIKVKKQGNSSLSSPLISIMLPSIFGVMAFIMLVIGGLYCLLKKAPSKNEVDGSSDIVVSTLRRFSFETLRVATQDFQTKLGQGGFGSVFEGTLVGGAKVAVKRLDSVGQGRKEFLAEVNTIGSIHHFCLVRLIGFCEERLSRLLVYEYMCNGSLDKWIFNQDRAQAISWNRRRRIIDGIAEGLRYLHEHCNPNVIHFDIKPQNILLDEDFNVRISDFGLAKMVDRNQSEVVTLVKGTPGYIAPELIIGKAISVKVDVYSFGVLVLEIVCGRRNLDSSPSDICLTSLVKIKADEDRLVDLIDECSRDVQLHKEEALKMLKIAIWCLQPHFIRPTMSMVVKVLHGPQDFEALTDLGQLSLVPEEFPLGDAVAVSTRPTESLLSGPR
ncbi:hypothetical protein Ancab_040553 [Ancistrocladus abbreviatus]